MFRKTAWILTGILMGQMSALASTESLAIAGKDAPLRCEINQISGEVSLVLYLGGRIAKPALIQTLELRSIIGKESWNNPTRYRRECEVRRRELSERDVIRGTLSVSTSDGYCTQTSESNWEFTQDQTMTFSVLSPNGRQYYSFQAFGSRTIDAPSCESSQ